MNKTKGVHVTWHGTIVSPDGTEIALGQSNWFTNLSVETFEALQRAEAAIERFVEAERGVFLGMMPGQYTPEEMQANEAMTPCEYQAAFAATLKIIRETGCD